MLAFCSDARFADHDPRPGHPERPVRVRAVARAVRQAGLVASADPFPDSSIDFAGRLARHGGPPIVEIDPTPIDPADLSAVHPAAYVEAVRAACEASKVLDGGDTPVHPPSWPTALLAAGAGVRCVDAVMTGERGVTRAFAAVRPPGHHAEPSRAMGFCLFANAALAARHAQRSHGVGRVAVVDFDVHHGNGTQAVFEADPSVLTVSLHQDPRTLWPGTGFADEVGVGPGRGTVVNVPLPPGTADAAYLAAFDARAAAAVDRFRPELIAVSAGFDAHADDPLAGLSLTDDGLAAITRRLRDLAGAHCGGRLVSVLEGGYDLHALGRGVVRHLIELA